MANRGVTPYRISKETGVAQSVLSTWKSGKHDPSLETLQLLADYFGVSLDYLSGRSTPPTDLSRQPSCHVGCGGSDKVYPMRTGLALPYGLKAYFFFVRRLIMSSFEHHDSPHGRPDNTMGVCFDAHNFTPFVLTRRMSELLSFLLERGMPPLELCRLSKSYLLPSIISYSSKVGFPSLYLYNTLTYV